MKKRNPETTLMLTRLQELVSEGNNDLSHREREFTFSQLVQEMGVSHSRLRRLITAYRDDGWQPLIVCRTKSRQSDTGHKFAGCTFVGAHKFDDANVYRIERAHGLQTQSLRMERLVTEMASLWRDHARELGIAGQCFATATEMIGKALADAHKKSA